LKEKEARYTRQEPTINMAEELEIIAEQQDNDFGGY
jgi:hypothetical protein